MNPQLSLSLLLGLTGGSLGLLIAERLGAPTTLNLKLKGDIKRETRFIAQYGQTTCALAAALLIWQLDRARAAWIPALLVAMFGASLLATIVKKLCGRVRPGHEGAGEFTGPSLKHANYRESFPSSHSAAAMGFSVVMAHLYPPAAGTFIVLALLCGFLRYVLDAHWLSDVVAGLALGYITAELVLRAFTAWGV